MPKPTSMRALIVVCTGLLATAFTAGVAASAGVGASIATGAGVVARTVAATVDAALFFDAADLVAGVGELEDFDVFFFDALMYVKTESYYPLSCLSLANRRPMHQPRLHDCVGMQTPLHKPVTAHELRMFSTLGKRSLHRTPGADRNTLPVLRYKLSGESGNQNSSRRP